MRDVDHLHYQKNVLLGNKEILQNFSYFLVLYVFLWFLKAANDTK